MRIRAIINAPDNGSATEPLASAQGNDSREGQEVRVAASGSKKKAVAGGAGT